MRLALLFAASLLIAAEPVHQRDFTFEYKATVKDIPAGTQKLEVWIPVPHDDPYQRILEVHVETPYPHQILTGDQGNTMLHLAIDQPKESSVPVTLTFHAVRLERIQPIVSVKNAVAPEDDLSRWLKPDRLVPID
ncbi:MAG: transglutaminase domain-containing protein, partial [Bryobacteraceae bacterium]